MVPIPQRLWNDKRKSVSHADFTFGITIFQKILNSELTVGNFNRVIDEASGAKVFYCVLKNTVYSLFKLMLQFFSLGMERLSG